MAIFSQKKPRSSRAASIRDSSSIAFRLHLLIRDRSVLLRLSLCVLGTLGLLFAVEGWKAAFPHRLGDRAEHGIIAKTDFTRVDRRRTENAVREAVENVHPVFRRVPGPVGDLPARLRSHLKDVAEAESLADLPEETRGAFGLDRPGAESGGSSQNLEEQFGSLKAVVSVGEGAASRIEELVEDFSRFIEPLKEQGALSAEVLSRHRIPRDRTIVIISGPGQHDREIVTASEVLLTEAIKETGFLGKAWVTHPKLVQIKPMLQEWLVRQSPVTLRYDAATTQRTRRLAREAVQDELVEYAKGQQLVAPGARIDEERLAVLRAQYEELESSVTWQQRIERITIIFVLVLVLMLLNGYYVVHNERQLVASPGRLAVFLAVAVVSVLLGRMLSYDPWRAESIPLVATVMVVAIAYNQVLATLTGFTLALIIALSTVADLGHFVVLMGVAATAVIPLARVPSRSTIIKVGFLTGLAFVTLTWGTEIIASQSLSDVWNVNTLKLSLKGGGWCVAAGYLVAGSLPFIESAFGVVTDISLLELSDVSHPLLQELVRRAPGTYNHSIAVATIGETAADRISANGLLVRVGAYYHDIGKMLKPGYFIENMTEDSPSRHQHLAPAMSTLIIIGHVKDGVDLAGQHNLPRPLIDFIEQHHGTTLVEYFYREATRKAGTTPDHKTDAEESSFRYPGPKPQTREAGVLMLADAVESASRTLHDPTPKRIERLVHEIVMKRLLDGQLDESSLTLTDINIVEESLTKSLIGIYHGRIKYPEQRTA